MSTVETRAALESLIAWWEAAGVDIAPPPTPRPEPPQSRPSAPRQGAPGASPRPAPPPPKPDAAEEDARAIAAKCATLDALKAALEAFEHPLRTAARTTVFARGNPHASVMIVGEAPGREEDREGLPFVGRSGQLMDRMFAEVGLTDAEGLYITNIVNWRPRNNRAPSEEEVALCRPFIARHVALKAPKVLVLAGAIAAQTLLGTTQGITRLRGKWMSYSVDGADIPALPIYHPAYILRRPIAKREVWRDLLSLEATLANL